MKFIEIQDGISIALDKIEAIKVIDSLSCEIIISGGFNTYIANFPKNVLLSFIEDVDEVDLQPQILSELMLMNKEKRYFAG